MFLSAQEGIAGGGFSAIEPWDEGDNTLAFVRDPDGVWIEMIGGELNPKQKSYCNNCIF